MTRILIVDDGDDIRLLLRMIITVEPTFEVVGEANGPIAGVTLARELQPDVIVTDHGFEGQMTGVEAAPLLELSAPAAKIVLFSAYDNLHEQVKETPSIDAFVLKTDAHNLVSVIKSLLTKD